MGTNYEINVCYDDGSIIHLQGTDLNTVLRAYKVYVEKENNVFKDEISTLHVNE